MDFVLKNELMQKIDFLNTFLSWEIIKRIFFDSLIIFLYTVEIRTNTTLS